MLAPSPAPTATNRGGWLRLEGGTLFLDEIGDLPLSLQVKILRLIQERVYEPLGDVQSLTADVRIVAATNRDLAALVEKEVSVVTCTIGSTSSEW